VYVGGLTAISLARFEVVKTELRSTQANDAVIMVGDARHGSHGSQGRVGLHAGSLRARLYIGGLAAISLARFEVVKTEVSCTRATEAIMLGDVRRRSRERAGPHGGSLHTAVVVVMFSAGRRGSRGDIGLHTGSLHADVVFIVFGAAGVKMAASAPPSSSWAPFVPGYTPAASTPPSPSLTSSMGAWLHAGSPAPMSSSTLASVEEVAAELHMAASTPPSSSPWAPGCMPAASSPQCSSRE
jgi:hypothetical protein